ncbi:homeodomain-interacting protein kinase 1-like [Micropterus salmoides]|uniref:homeodomain-interacting protein kinase 1-like n=1 Tax=Micropterus salmoides TaxID=27706 RepID=UPI0018EBC64B|nr:homeodomain-interacting protein kinase 1-like [Micropterus salmoides]
MIDDQDFQVVVGGLISSSSSLYEVQDILGCGAYGEVTQCRKLATNETVAVKILKSKTCIEEAKEEEVILKKMKELDSDMFNIVRWNDSFTFEGRFCLEFEKLDINLYEILQMNNFQPLKLMEIRPIVQQLAIALEFLKRIGIVHADLKPENIMMVDHLRQPLRVKIIDFGLAFVNPEEWTGVTLQTQWYRSPEVLLGASFNEAIDVWSLGCIAAEMLIGTALFPGNDEYDMMRHILCATGKPPDHLLNAGLYTEQFFNAKYTGLEPPLWRFMSTVEAKNITCNPVTITGLSDLKKVSCKLSGEDASADECDRASFVDLITKTLKVDASERITPSQILQHRFITMSHLVGTFDSHHVKLCVKLMNICHGRSSDDDEDVNRVTLKTCLIVKASNCTASPACVPNEGHPSSREELSLQSSVISEKNCPPKKRKSDGADESECGNIIPAKTRSDEYLDAVPTEAGEQAIPQRSPLYKRKRDDVDPCITSDGNYPAKKKSVNLNKELTDSMKKFLSNTEQARSSHAWDDHIKKRKKTNEDDSGSKQAKISANKRSKGSLEEKGEPT